MVVHEIAKMLRRLIGENIEIVSRASAAASRVYADPGQIEQILVNLALNSRDAMPGGGQLVLETHEVVLGEAYAAEHAGVAPGPYVMLTVSDNGSGMSPATMAQIFEPFFTTKESGKGTGLGLSMVYGIVQQSGGHIAVESEQGRGTIFRIYLPRVDAGPEAEPEPAGPLKAAKGGTETILLFEDSDSLRLILREMLEEAGYEVLDGATLEEAMAFSITHPGPIHLVLSDVVMPGASGPEIVAFLRTQRPEIRAVFMSGYTDEAIVRHGVLDRGIHFLQKPFTSKALRTKLRAVLDASALGRRGRGTIARRRVFPPAALRTKLRQFPPKDRSFADSSLSAAPGAAGDRPPAHLPGAGLPRADDGVHRRPALEEPGPRRGGPGPLRRRGANLRSRPPAGDSGDRQLLGRRLAVGGLCLRGGQRAREPALRMARPADHPVARDRRGHRRLGRRGGRRPPGALRAARPSRKLSRRLPAGRLPAAAGPVAARPPRPRRLPVVRPRPPAGDRARPAALPRRHLRRPRRADPAALPDRRRHRPLERRRIRFHRRAAGAALLVDRPGAALLRGGLVECGAGAFQPAHPREPPRRLRPPLPAVPDGADQPADRRFLHLVDGGVSDDLGTHRIANFAGQGRRHRRHFRARSATAAPDARRGGWSFSSR